MENKEFNLLWEPWIRVRLPDCSICEVSTEELFCHAERYTDLAGELPTQDIAVLRLLLAVLHAVFTRYDADGEEEELKSAQDALQRWKSLWDAGKFPEKPILAYLETWKERFWLFHPERPFWQVPSAVIGSPYSASKLNGEISESSHKPRLFPCRTFDDRNRLTYSEAARWLIHTNAYEDAGIKKKGDAETKKTLESIGVCWLGECGLLYAQGENLFQTLMLNLVFTDSNGELWENAEPVWEKQPYPEKQRERIAVPNDQADLLTLQSRRLLLNRENEYVTGYLSLGGSFFDKANTFQEQMTLWYRHQEKKNEPADYLPYTNRGRRQIWRDFEILAAEKNNANATGIVRWLCQLQTKNILKKTAVYPYRFVSVEYDGNRSSIVNIFSDSLSVQLQIFNEVGKDCRSIIISEVAQCEKIAQYIGTLAYELDIAAGNTDPSFDGKAKEQFYYRVDIPFREWLRSLEPSEDYTVLARQCDAWRETARKIALDYGRELVEQSGPAAFIGRNYKKNAKDTERHYSAPEAYNRFLSYMGKYGTKQKGDETV